MSEPQVDYNTIQGDPENYTAAQLEMAIGKTLCTELAKHYPGRAWACATDLENGVVAVMEQNISKSAGYLLYLSRPMEELRGMMFKVGGEILERAGVPTGKQFNPEILETLSRDARDDVISPDLITPEAARLNKNEG